MAVFGDTLRQARAYKGVTLKEAEQATRINRHHLAALEDENFAVLPPLIYQRGIIRNYANYLDLDPGKLLGLFDEARGGESSGDLVAAVRPLEMPSHWAPNFAIIAFMVVMSAVVFAWAYSAYFAPPEESATATAVIPTVTAIPDDQLVFSSPTSEGTVATEPSAFIDTPVAIISAPGSSTAPPTATASPLPTATAVPTISAAPTMTPLPLPTSTPVPPPTEPAPPPPAPAAPAQEEAPPAQTAGQLAVTFTATDWVYLSVRADGAIVFEGDVAPGATTNVFYGQSFDVYSSNVAATSVTVNGGSPFVMSYDAGEGTFTLP